jgi:hypothetical protein
MRVAFMNDPTCASLGLDNELAQNQGTGILIGMVKVMVQEVFLPRCFCQLF